MSRNSSSWPCRKTGNSKSTLDLVDYEAIRNSIDGIANKLFKQDGTVELLVCRWSEKEKLQPTPIFSHKELDTYMQKHFLLSQVPQTSSNQQILEQSVSNEVSKQPISKSILPALSTHLFLIDQEHTKSSLDITQDSLNLLLNHLSAFPQLGFALPAFAASDIPIHEGRTSFHARDTVSPSGTPLFELCMLLKYVEPNGNKADPIPFSIRQELLYQNFGTSGDQEVIVLFRTSAALKRRITEEFYAQGGHARHWTNVPVLAVASLASNWAEYCKFLDEEVWKIDKSSTHTNPFHPSLGEANTKTLQATQKYYDLLTRAVHVLQNNIHILNSLSRIQSRKTLEMKVASCSEHYDVLSIVIEDTKYNLTGFIKHLELIQARLNRITEGIRDSIALRSSHHAATETETMRSLTAQSIREARTVKAIALVTLIYLPATFVATFLGMNSISVTSGRRGFLHVAIDPELWIYLALTIPLTLCTLAAWWGWEWWSKRKHNRKEDGGLERRQR